MFLNFAWLLIYIPRDPFTGPGFGTFSTWRVASGSLSLISRRFFINQNPFWELILVSLPNNVSNIKGYL
jgi:hypothetical protein